MLSVAPVVVGNCVFVYPSGALLVSTTLMVTLQTTDALSCPGIRAHRDGPRDRHGQRQDARVELIWAMSYWSIDQRNEGVPLKQLGGRIDAV